MNKRCAVGLGACFVGVVLLAGAACRTGDPTGDPKTPPNSPFPTIDKKDPDHGSSPVGDGG